MNENDLYILSKIFKYVDIDTMINIIHINKYIFERRKILYKCVDSRKEYTSWISKLMDSVENEILDTKIKHIVIMTSIFLHAFIHNINYYTTGNLIYTIPIIKYKIIDNLHDLSMRVSKKSFYKKLKDISYKSIKIIDKYEKDILYQIDPFFELLRIDL